MKKTILIILSIIMAVATIVSAHGNTLEGNADAIKIAADASSVQLEALHVARLPEPVQHFLTENDDVMCIVVSLHEVELGDDGLIKDIISTHYDLSKHCELDAFENHVARMKEKYALDIGVKTGEHEYNHGGWIITGLNVSRVLPSSWHIHYQLQGWWDWQNGILVTGRDQVGLSWTPDYNSSESTQFAYGIRYMGGALNLVKHEYATPEFINKGVLWRHAEPARSYGVVTTQIFTNQSQRDTLVQFQYVNDPPDTNPWYVSIKDALFGLLPWVPPVPGARYFISPVRFMSP